MNDKTELLDNERQLSFDAGAVDIEARTIQVRFSSEYPVRTRHNGEIVDEILNHDAASCDLGRLRDGAPVLVDHDKDFDGQIGVVENAQIDADKSGRAVVRLSKVEPRAERLLHDAADGIRRNVSCHYKIHQYRMDRSGEIPKLIATRWEPTEITFTPVGADPTAQVGRADQGKTFPEEITMSDDKKDDSLDGKRIEIDVDQERQKARRAETARVREITATGKRFDCDDLAEKAIGDEWSADKFNRRCLDLVAERQDEKPVSQLGLTKTEVSEYSLLRAARAFHNGDFKNAGFEFECSRAISDEVGKEPNGFYVPFEIQAARTDRRGQKIVEYDGQRVMTVGSATGGGYLVGTDHLASSFIDLLRARALMGRLNARFLPGLIGNVDIPRLDGGIAFNWVTEDADATPDDAVLGTLAMAPKTVVGEVPISRRLLKQSAPSVEAMLLDDMAQGATLAIDLAAFEGSGAAGQPTGIVNTSGVGTSTIAAPGAPTFVEVVEFETDVLSANALGGTLAYCVTAPVQGSAKTTFIDSGSGIRLMQNREMNGYPVQVSTQLAANSIVFGNYEDVIIGMWGVLDVEPDKAEKAASGGLVLRVFQDIDIGVRHAGSFSVNA